MRRGGYWLSLVLLLTACQREPEPSPEQFQFPVGIFIQARRNDFWEAFETGLKSRLDASIVPRIVYFDSAQRDSVASQMAQPEAWRALAFCAPSDAWAQNTVDRAVREGIPLVLVGVDMRQSLRMGVVSTYYYDAGRKAGAWYAKRLPTGRIVVIAGHPVPGAVSEFWDGFRHSLLENRRLRAELIPLSDSAQAKVVAQQLKNNPTVRGIFLMGAEVARYAMEATPLPNPGIFTWRQDDEAWYHEGRCQLLLIENPHEVGVRTANLLRNLSLGRGKDLEIVYVPYRQRAR